MPKVTWYRDGIPVDESLVSVSSRGDDQSGVGGGRGSKSTSPTGGSAGKNDHHGLSPSPVRSGLSHGDDHKNALSVTRKSSFPGSKGSPSVVESELFIQKVARKDLKSVLKCEAVNNNFTSPSFISVALDINCKW